MAQPALGSIEDAARWRESFGRAALAKTDEDYHMRAVILIKVALRKTRRAAADSVGDGGFLLYIPNPSLEIEGRSQEKHFARS